MIRFETAKNGEICASYEGRYLHSRYSPRSEAERYFSGILPSSSPAVLLILEPGCGYLTELVEASFGASKIIELHCRSEFSYRHRHRGRAHIWSPGEEKSLHDFLYSALEDYELPNLQILDWEPARRLFPEDYERLATEVMQFIRERNASLTTEGMFGPRWLNNLSVNIRRLPPLLTPRSREEAKTIETPVVIAAPGTSLEKHMDLLRRHRERFCLLSVSSALEPLLNAELHPDGVIHTDPGYWAAHHLAPLRSTSGASALQPLTARPYPTKPGTRRSSPPSASRHPLPDRMLLLSNGNPLEEFLLDYAKVPYLRIPSHGSVSGSALYTAGTLSVGPVIFAGLDLAFNDIRSHVHGHSFDRVLLSSVSRFSPAEMIYYRRSSRSGEPVGRAADRSLNAYAAWFSRHTRYRRLYALGSHSSHICTQLQPEDFSALLADCTYSPLWNGTEERPAVSGEAALTALADRIKKEMAKLHTIRHASETACQHLHRHPLLDSFLGMADRAAQLQFYRRAHMAMNTKEVLERLLSSAAHELDKLQSGYPHDE